MADNIRIIGNITNTSVVSRYSTNDISLIPSKLLKENFGGENDYIEFYIYDAGGNLLKTEYSYLNYKLPSNSSLSPGALTSPNTTGNIQTTNVGIDSTLSTPTSSLYPIIEIDPVRDLQDSNYSTGEFITRYNLFQKKISDPFNQNFFLKEISQDRTEVRLASLVLENGEIEEAALTLLNEMSSSAYQIDYLLNFGDNEQYIIVNTALNKNPDGYEILFKLYEPLPLSVQEKSFLWVVKEKVLPYVFNINLDKIIIPAPPPTLRGPNFTIPIENQGTISTTYGNYSSLIANLQSLQSSSYSQIQSLLATQSIDINVDYTDFDNFVFFSSAKQRVVNFYDKVKEIEDYQNFINQYRSFVATTASLQTTINQYSASINNVISQFDGYEYYLYFESSSYAWPKSGSLKPFSLLSTGSATVVSWYNALTGSAEDYDEINYDNLEYAIPAFIKDDGNNQPFLTFLNMVGHYFDNIWIYLKSVTDINLANNNLDYGISRDLVYHQLKSLGVKLYNSQAGDSVDGYLIGANTGSSVFDNNFTITGSYLNNVPRADLVAELYKRIYHNLPLLLKTKGTVAGLDYLMSTFGIPNQTYYVITSGSISSSFYTPTGSAATASILSVKEFGGSLKSGLVKGYNNDKVRIVPNNITGSVLSSELSLQTFPTASSAFRDDDLHYVDISFSPQNQIDTYISGAIASNNPTWILDDYIGDPRQQYSGSYPDLDAQRKLYFETGVSGFNPFTASLLDYNGFIRLIEFFDNSLFKMLNDFVPERTSLSTGVTINSPVLERNKAVYSIPNFATESIKNADYEIGEITAQYGQLYDALSGDRKPFFTGELSGSIIDVNQYFEDDFNPYDGDWDVWNAQRSISQSINLNSFLHSDWNVLLNNVSKSVESNIRKQIEYIWGTTGSITSSAELQDSYLTLRSYNTSRYDGSKVTSLTYNNYTTGSYTGSDGRTIVTGDKSFGKTAAIDLNTYKVGWVKNIPSQSLNFPDKTSISLKYLVDINSNVTELSRANFNLVEVQNTFKSGTPVVLSISDVRKPSLQITLDGTKNIFKGGFSYDPIIFREGNETLYFRHDNYISSSQIPLGVKVGDTKYYGYKSIEYDNNNNGIQASPITPSDTNPAVVTQQNPGGGGINGNYNFIINGSPSTAQGAAMSYRRDSRTSWRYNNNPRTDFAGGLSSYGSGWGLVQVPNNQSVYSFDLLKFFHSGSGGYNTETDPSTYVQLNDGTYAYKIPRQGTYTIKASIPFSFYFQSVQSAFTGGGNQKAKAFKPVAIVEKCPAGLDPNVEGNWNNIVVASELVLVQGSWNGGIISSTNFVYIKNNMSTFADCNIQIPGSSYNYTTTTVGEHLRFRFYFVDISDVFGFAGNFEGTKHLEFYINSYSPNSANNTRRGYFEIFDQNTTVTQYQYTSSYGQIPQFFTASLPSTLIFHQSASYLFTTASTFTPQLPSSQYYTPVVDYFGIQKYDLIRLGSIENSSPQYYEIINVSSSATNVYVTLNRPITSSFNDYAQNFAIFRRKPDETSVIVDFKKTPGEVSQTILVPYNINDNTKNNIGNIFKTLNTDLQ